MSEYYAVVRSTDHLAHYGVKGMKWGVRKAVETGNQRALDRHFRRAAKKLKKLTDIGLNSKKYAAKAAAYGAAAAGAGTVAVLGTKGYAAILQRKAKGLMQNAKYTQAASSPEGKFTFKSKEKNPLDQFTNPTARKQASEAGKTMSKAKEIEKWGEHRKTSPTSSIKETVEKNGDVTYTYTKGPNTETGLSRNQKLRIAAGAVSVGLGTLSAVNAYRAANPQKYRAKAVQYKNAMDEAFAGTKYAGKYIAEPRMKKRRKRG